jgi:hypothetical protein
VLGVFWGTCLSHPKWPGKPGTHGAMNTKASQNQPSSGFRCWASLVGIRLEHGDSVAYCHLTPVARKGNQKSSTCAAGPLRLTRPPRPRLRHRIRLRVGCSGHRCVPHPYDRSPQRRDAPRANSRRARAAPNCQHDSSDASFPLPHLALRESRAPQHPPHQIGTIPREESELVQRGSHCDNR